MAWSVDRSWDNPQDMLSVDDALQRILSAVEPLPPEPVNILDAVGMVLARDIVAGEDVPPFRNSAMDGYAVRAEDTVHAPLSLRVTGTVAAGDVPQHPVIPGESMRIMTGAPLPQGADAVVRFEETDEAERGPASGSILIRRAVRPWENVREPGEDVRAGTVALIAGTRLRPAEIGVLASLNQRTVEVHRRPVVGILATGNEVVGLGYGLQPGQIRDSNSYVIAALVRRLGAIPRMLGIARDETTDLAARLRGANAADLFVTSGGVSLGDYDVVKDVLQREGAVDIWQVRMKPGKPLAFGHIGGVPLIGLPGNPVAALVSFEQFARPAILRMLGRKDTAIREVTATTTHRLENRGGRRHYVRGTFLERATGPEVSPSGESGSAILTSVARSDCLIVVPETCVAIEAGETVRVQLPDEGL